MSSIWQKRLTAESCQCWQKSHLHIAADLFLSRTQTSCLQCWQYQLCKLARPKDQPARPTGLSSSDDNNNDTRNNNNNNDISQRWRWRWCTQEARRSTQEAESCQCRQKSYLLIAADLFLSRTHTFHLQ